ncbi:transposase ISAs1 family protein (plasmid) [Gloeothece citriformis PCC 7424]|uniref:Transposase ISAs1 family protein n=1 Tax=Gloeothece citriformis (strain PCC 7424) TaxID=65393 RepID=B7KLR5_GLOC7|nr:ISAs1-like element ISCysp7 family transposase [Gloeothece citriformis]ACK73737.1 transposase ISAs1 family protein [Gloeothece citriformis PCC 7424]
MKLKPKITIEDYFGELEDPRIERTKKHKLIDIITITICAVICGADSWIDIEVFGKCKYKWLKKFLELPNGIPSHDTFGRVFSLLNPEHLQQIFLKWIQSISSFTQGEIVAIDGKTLRHSYDRSKDKPALQMISAWATTNGLVLGQSIVDEKSNEITAIPDGQLTVRRATAHSCPHLLKVLSLSGCIVTLDAIGCQKEIVKQITEQDADYVITLKKNQGGLYERVENLFKKALMSNFEGFIKSEYKVKDEGHGRQEVRYYQMLSNVAEEIDPDWQWLNLNSIGYVEYLRVENGTDKTSLERRYFISSLNNNIKLFASSVREHWCIENQCHWILDVQFNEDDSRIRKDNAPANMAILRHLALNLLKQEKTLKVGVKAKRKKAGWDENYLLKVLRN